MRRNHDDLKRLTREISNIEFVKTWSAERHLAAPVDYARDFASDNLNNLTYLNTPDTQIGRLGYCSTHFALSYSSILKYQARTLRVLVS